MLVDKVKIKVIAGRGGDGSVHFARNGKPNGGDGGQGGSIYLEGTTNVFDLRYFRQRKKYKAEDGEIGFRERQRGADGEDLVLKVPLITELTDMDGNVLLKVNDENKKHLIAEGGIGGLGNYQFRAGQVHTLKKFTKGKPGEVFEGFLDLTLEADAVFIGLPNVGKSSMLNALSDTKVKVAAYPFTTLEPNLGVVAGKKLMDLPGLIQGTYKGKGLGKRTLKHTKTAKLIAHFISLESEKPMSDYKLIRNEIEQIAPHLLKLPEIVVLTKSDNVDKEQIKTTIKAFEKPKSDIVPVSIYDDEALEKLRERIIEKLN